MKLVIDCNSLILFCLVFKDTNTQSPFVDHLNVPNDDGSAAKYGKPDHVYMDAMGFGMGSNCLQVKGERKREGAREGEGKRMTFG